MGKLFFSPSRALSLSISLSWMCLCLSSVPFLDFCDWSTIECLTNRGNCFDFPDNLRKISINIKAFIVNLLHYYSHQINDTNVSVLLCVDSFETIVKLLKIAKHSFSRCIFSSLRRTTNQQNCVQFSYWFQSKYVWKVVAKWKKCEKFVWNEK